MKEQIMYHITKKERLLNIKKRDSFAVKETG